MSEEKLSREESMKAMRKLVGDSYIKGAEDLRSTLVESFVSLGSLHQDETYTAKKIVEMLSAMNLNKKVTVRINESNDLKVGEIKVTSQVDTRTLH